MLKIQFQGRISRVHMFLGTRNPILRSILKPEVDLMVFLCMRSNTSTFQCIYITFYSTLQCNKKHSKKKLGRMWYMTVGGAIS